MSNTNHDFLVKNGLVVGQAITSTGTLTQAGQTFPASDGSAGQYLKTNGSGALSWGTVNTSFNITDGTTTDTVGSTETVTFTGGTNISLAVTDNTVTITNDVVDSDDITEGSSNLFYTNARAIAAIQGASNLTIDGGTLYVDTAADRVGISDTSPQQKLDVAGNIGVNGSEVIDASGNIVGSVADSAMTVGGSLAGVLSNLKVQYGTAYSGTPIQGSFFFDSLNQKLKVYTGSAFIDAVPAGSGGGGGGGATDANTTFRNYSYTLTGTTSAVSGVDDNELTAGAFIIGHKYTITSVGNTDFTAIGASGNTVGVVFIATGVGSGTGQAKQTLFYDTTSSATRVVAYVNGIKQVYGSGRDFVATTGTSVAFTYNLGSGDTVDIQVYELLTNAAYYLKSEVYTQTQVNSQISTGVSSYLPLAGGTMTGNLAINNGSPEMYFGTTGNHYNWRIAAQEVVDAGFEIAVGSQDTDYSNDTYTPKFVVKASGNVGIGETNPLADLHITSGGDNLRITNTRSGTQGAQLDLLHFSSSPADGDNQAQINMGGYFSGTSSAYFSSIRGIATDTGLKHGRIEFLTRDDNEFSPVISLHHNNQTLFHNVTSTYTGSSDCGGFIEPVVSSSNTAQSGMKIGGGSSADNNHSIWLRTGYDGTVDVNDYHQYGSHRFFTGGAIASQTLRMTITNDGGIAFGTGGTEPGNGNTNTGAGLRSLNTPNSVMFSVSRNAGNTCRFNRNGVSGSNINMSHDGGNVGSIDTSTSGTTYNTTSDRRLKDNIEPIADATDKLMDMNPVTHTWKADPEAPQVHGFIAQEMQEVIPEAVSGDADSDEMMSMDYGRITPVIVAALQDALKEIKELKTRIDELESK